MHTPDNSASHVDPVREQVANLLRTFPSLYRNRLMALLAIFDSSEYRWVAGNLVPICALAPDDHDHLPYSEQDCSESKDVGQRLLALRENAMASFVHQHAELLAQHLYGRFERAHHIAFDGRHFDTMPADVKPHWRDAAFELAASIMAHKPLDMGTYESRYQASRVKDHEKSQKVCRQFLERHKMLTMSPADRQARIAVLQKEAQALGLSLVEVAE